VTVVDAATSNAQDRGGRGGVVLAGLRVLAVVLAFVLAAGETLRSWGAGRPWFSVADDYFMAALLVVAAVLAAKREGPALLCGGFGFASGMLYGSFFGHVEALSRHEVDPGNIPQSCLTEVIGVLFVSALVGFGLSVRDAVRRR
jgi:hypothetical protein